MFMTRMALNPHRRGARKLIASPQVMHAAVLAGFAEPPVPAPDGARVLWRIDENPADRRTLLYLISPDKPDLTHLVEQAGWPTTQEWECKRYDKFVAALADGDTWAFRLTANPVHNGRTKTDAARTQRLGHVTYQQQQDWLLSRAERNGFRITLGENDSPDVVVHRRKVHRFQRRENTVTLTQATFDGRLVITDVHAFRQTLVRGLGHGKSYGCGLMTLARVS